MSKRLTIPLVGVLGLLAIWFGLWWVATGVLMDRAAAWVAATSNDEGSLTHGPLTRAGFPLEIAVDFPDVVVSSPGYSATAPRLRLSVAPWAPSRLRFQTGGVATMTAPIGPILRVAGIDATLDRTADDRERLSLDLVEPKSAIPGQPTISIARLLLVATRKLSDPTPATLFLDATTLQTSLSAERLDLKLQALWRGPMLLGAPLNFAAWRDAGGEFELRDVVASNGASKISAGAVFTLDQALRPVPKGAMTLQGAKPFLDRLTALGVTSQRDAAIGQTALTLLSKPGADGQPEVTLPISGRDGWLMIGPLRVARLPSLPSP